MDSYYIPTNIDDYTSARGGGDRKLDVEDNRLLGTMRGLQRGCLADCIYFCEKIAKQK